MAVTKRRNKPKVTQKVPVTMQVTTRLPGAENVQEMYELDVLSFDTEPAYVGIKAGITRQPQDYESIRVDVNITAPCYREDIENTADAVSDLVYDRLKKEIDAYMGVSEDEAEDDKEVEDEVEEEDEVDEDEEDEDEEDEEPAPKRKPRGKKKTARRRS